MDLLKGTAIVIDNGIETEENIKRIIKNIRENSIPLVSFDSLETAESSLPHWRMVNFIILDWKMVDLPDGDDVGVRMGATAIAENQRKVIDFIKKIKDVCFAPLFIFTTEPQEDIRDQIIPALKSNNLYFDEKERNFIFVKNKTDVLRKNKLFFIIKRWISDTPSIYLLKIWENELLKAKNKVFWDLYNASKGVWPKVLWEHFERENENPKICLNETIFQLVMSDSSLNDLDRKKIMRRKPKPELNEIKKIFRRTMFQENDLHGVKPGDIFKMGGKYYLNIRPECDTVEGRPQFANEIYVIEGDKLSSGQLERLRKKQYSKIGLIEKISEAFIFLLDDKDVVKFSFTRIKIKQFSKLREQRICRLLPPYINNIQQRVNSYFGRFGIPRLPYKIEKELLKTE